MKFITDFKNKRQCNNIIKAYNDIKDLYAATMFIDNPDDLAKKVIETQQGILKNNFNMLAKAYEVIAPPLNYLDIATFTNLQGAAPRIGLYEGTLDKARKDLTFHNLIIDIEDILKLETKFYNLRPMPLKYLLYHKIQDKTFSKIKDKISIFASSYNNQQAVIDFILKDHSLVIIKHRLVFIFTYFNPKDSIKLSLKKITVIPIFHMTFITIAEVEQLIKDLDIKQSDYLIQTKD